MTAESVGTRIEHNICVVGVALIDIRLHMLALLNFSGFLGMAQHPLWLRPAPPVLNMSVSPLSRARSSRW